MRFHRRTLLLIAACAALIGGASRLSAQSVGSIRGKVVEGGTQRPLAGVQVTVPGTGRGALSDGAGNYLINNVPSGQHTVRAEMLGFATVDRSLSVTASQSVVQDFQLNQVALALNELVVTGVPGAVTKRTLGNSITKLDAADLAEKTVVSNVAEMLQSRTPGLTFLPNSGIPGAAGEMRIRGAGSLAVSNMPVVYVDGVRYNTGSYGSFTPSGAGNTSYQGQNTSAFDGIDPSDIESIEVIKGPAAATLYGAEAAAGVIQIITKKGKIGQQAMQWSAKFEYGGNDWSVGIPDNYTTCDAARVVDPNWPGCLGKPVGTVLVANPLRDDPNALRTGMVRRMTLNLRGGGDNFSYFLTGDQDDQQGVFFNSYEYRKSVRANFQLSPSAKFDLSTSTNYSRSKLRLPLGDESAEGLLLSAFRGRPGRVASAPGREGWGGTSAAEANNYNNTTVADHLTLGTTVQYRPLEWFKNRLTMGLDYTSSLAQVISPPNSIDASYAGYPQGLIAQRTPRNYLWTLDYAGNVDRRLTEDLLATTSFGAQYTSRRWEQVYAYGYGLAAPEILQIGKTQTNYGDNSFTENKSIGFFGQEQLGWKDRLYATGALRMDNNSSFGANINRYFYPKASLAYVASDEPALKHLIEAAHVDNLKLRAAWGRAGRSPDPYWANQVYTGYTLIQNGSVGSTIGVRAVGNPDLKPEKGQEIEAGFEAGFLQERAGVDFTYYRKNMHDVLIPASVAGSTGFGGTFTYSMTAPYMNLGNTVNQGIELSLKATPVLSRHFAWDTRVDMSTNRNELVTFGDPYRTSLAISGQSYANVQQHRPGYPLGGYWAALPKHNADGSLVIDAATGLAVADTASYIGPSMPTREGSWSNTFTLFRNLRVFAMVDYKGGFYNFNGRDWQRCRVSTQLNCQAVNDPANVDLTNMDISKVPPKNPDVRIWRANIPGYWVQAADFIKFRDLSLTYTVPSQFITPLRLRALSLTGAAHNLGILWTKYDGIDPEVNSYNGGNYASNGFARSDIYALPMIRRVTFSANVSF